MRYKFLHPSSFTCSRSLAFLAALLALPALSYAQDAVDPYKKSPAQATKPETPPAQAVSTNQLFTTVEWIEMETKDALALIRRGLSPNSAELIAAIRKSEQDGTAKVLDTVSCATRSGQRCAVESVREHIYPTEYKENTEKGLSTLDLSGVQSKDPRFSLVQEPATTLNPKAFEMRPVGARMEIEPVLSEDGQVVDVNVAPELVRYAGKVEYGSANINNKLVPLTEQPVFVSNKITTAVTLHSGQTALIGVSSPIKDDGTTDETKKVLLLIQVVAFSQATP
ncbi:hypothetical protein [Verrucomicrobium sp. BvORR106]|uniref:hypothetical protein n=1 Tax=Verrucomicrobium sp. BvORR106 TaxID=1403819 RepID=UPI000A65DEAA|nr:hypothetical protein [Verrucomicrobium sp. BvORR106]